MRKRNLAICDAEKRYLYKLQEILDQRESFPFEILTYTERKTLIEDIGKKGIGVILISDELYCDEIKAASGNKLIILLDSGVETAGKLPSIWKYQSGEKIRKELLRLFSEYKTDGEEVILAGVKNKQIKRETKLIGIFSPVGRCLKTSFSIVLSMCLAKAGPVLYLNLSCFSGIAGELGGQSGKSIIDLIYYLEGGAERLIFKLEEMVSTVSSIDYVGPPESYIDLLSIESEKWLKLLETLGAYGSYEYIILDLSQSVSGLPDILRCCNQIITIEKSDKWERQKLNEYQDFLKKMEYEDVLNKTFMLELPSFRQTFADVNSLQHSEMVQYIQKLIQEEKVIGV